MPSNNIYPPISQLLPKVNLPIDLTLINGFVANVFDNLYYKDLIAENSRLGDAGFYKFNLITYKSIGYEIPGTDGLALLFNPGFVDNGTNNTVIPLSFEYQLEVVKYINGLSPSNFQSDPLAYFNLILEILDLSVAEVLEQSIAVLINDPNPIQKFITDFNAVRGASNNIVQNSGQDPNDIIDIAIQVEQRGFDNYAVIFEDYVNVGSINEVLDKLKLLFDKWFGNIDIEELFKKLFIPKFRAGIDNISLGLQFPESVFQPVTPAFPGEKTILTFNVGSISYDSENGFAFNSLSTFNFPKSYILGTKFYLEVQGLKLDLSRTENIPEAIADGRPNDFVGVFMQQGTIGFPADWNHDDPNSTGELYVSNLLAGTGGISGTIGLRAKSSGNPAPFIKAKFGSGFEVELHQFDLTFQQNKIIGSNIKGSMLIPGFKDNSNNPAKIFIDIHIGQNGEFNIVASVTNAVTVLKIPNVFAFDVKSIFFGKQASGRFYIGCSGAIDFLTQAPLDKFLPDKLDINKLIIYDDGKFEIEGGSIYLPKAFELKLGPAKIAITAIHLGSYEKEDRKYKYFGFDGGVNVNPGGVDARGKGIKFYFTTDNGPFKWFIRLESLSIDIIIPGSSKPEDAAVIIKGFLSMKDPIIPPGTVDPLLTILKNSTEYAGGVYVSVPKFKGLEVSAAMRLNPKVPSFIIDLGVEISTPILLGSTGLGIYGFRALFGKRYVADKLAAALPPDAEWWQYYKAKIDPDFKEGIQISKFLIKEGFSVGAGVSLATSSDSGKAFSSKLFFLLSLPDVFLFQGQAQFLKDRIKLDANPDPPFFTIIAITKHSVEAAFGIDYKMPDTGADIGKLVTVNGVTELGFFFGNSTSWYFNIGRETPESRRIQARLFSILNMYFYFMMSSAGIRAGAGVSFGLKKSFGPLSAELQAYLDTKGRIAFRPKQIGGSIQMGGTVSLKCCGFGFSVSGGATLAAEAPKPHIITGEFEVCVKVLKKKRCAHFQFTWNFNNTLDDSRNPVLVDVPVGQNTISAADINKVAKSNHMVTGETLNLASLVLYDGQSPTNPPIPDPTVWITNSTDPDDYRIPVDAFIDIEFKKGLNAIASNSNNLGKLGGLSNPAQYIEYVAPQKGKSDRVRHEYFLENIEIKFWDETNQAWTDYDFYNAMIPLYPNVPNTVGALIDPTTLQNMKWGYWQQQQAGLNNKLRILATTPLSYASKLGTIPVEDLGINSNTILCPGNAIPKTCVLFDNNQVYKAYVNGILNAYQGLLIKVTTKDGLILTIPYTFGAGPDPTSTGGTSSNGLIIEPGETFELYFNEPMKYVYFVLNSGAPGISIEYYERTQTLDANGNPVFSGGLPVYQYNLITTKNYTIADWKNEIFFSDANKNVDYVKISTISCYKADPGVPPPPRKITCLTKDDRTITLTLKLLQNFFSVLIKNNHFTAASVQLNPQFATTYTGVYQGTILYPNQNYKNNIITLTQGYISGTTLLFTIADNLGYSCNYSFTLLVPKPGFSFNNIVSIVSITPYTTGATQGINYTFLMVVKATIAGQTVTVEIIGKSCHAMAYCLDACSTGLYRVCYLSYADYLLNQTVPSVSQQNADNQQLFDSINKTLQPIWRPNTTYAIRLKTSDRLYREGGNSQLTNPYFLDIVYGFKTAGPVGHYHNYPIDNTTNNVAHQKDRQDFSALVAQDKADNFKLTSLKYYIDYDKSYPNADSDIINAKPLFYNNAELRLFYLYNYVYEFFNDWVDYNHGSNLIAKASLDVLIRDPEDSSIPEMNAQLSFVGNSIPHNGTPPNNINSINNDVSILNNMLLNGNPCVSTNFNPLAPIDISTKKTLNLKPLKAYTAQFIAKYNPVINTLFAQNDYSSLVHTYVFQTSRYKDFTEQVNSYILKYDSNLNIILKEAVFVIKAEKAGTPTPLIDLNMGKDVITNNLGNIPDALKQQYADQFDRLINGILHIDYNVLHAAVTTEFNIVRHPDSPNKVIGILIRNPEPFNDPKIPKADPNISSTEPTETLQVSKWNGIGWDSPSDFYVIHSKDRSKMFVTNRSFDFDVDPLALLKFSFEYKLFNGTSYASISAVDVEINLATYTI